MKNPEVNVTFFDTTARDGAQSLPEENQFPAGSKYNIANEVARLGVGVIEVGFPRTPFDADEVRDVARTIGQDSYEVSEWVDGEQRFKARRPVVIAGLCRVDQLDIDTGWDAVHAAKHPRIHTFVSTDDEHREARFPGKSRDELADMARKGVSYAKSISAGHEFATVEFSAEAASTTPMSYLERIVKTAVDEGADVINVPDTVGQKDPIRMYQFYQDVINWVMKSNPDTVISSHNHNDLGQAVANTGMLVNAAAKWADKNAQSVNIQLETTVCGLGERAGNADIFPVAASLFKFSPELEVPIRWQFNPGQSVRVAQSIMNLSGLTVDRQNPVVGSDIMRHRSGIHSDGVIKGGHRMYTPFSPTFWGHAQDSIHEVGKYQGKAGRAAATGQDT